MATIPLKASAAFKEDNLDNLRNRQDQVDGEVNNYSPLSSSSRRQGGPQVVLSGSSGPAAHVSTVEDSGGGGGQGQGQGQVVRPKVAGRTTSLPTSLPPSWRLDKDKEARIGGDNGGSNKDDPLPDVMSALLGEMAVRMGVPMAAPSGSSSSSSSSSVSGLAVPDVHKAKVRNPSPGGGGGGGGFRTVSPSPAAGTLPAASAATAVAAGGARFPTSGFKTLIEEEDCRRCRSPDCAAMEAKASGGAGAAEGAVSCNKEAVVAVGAKVPSSKSPRSRSPAGGTPTSSSGSKKPRGAKAMDIFLPALASAGRRIRRLSVSDMPLSIDLKPEPVLPPKIPDAEVFEMPSSKPSKPRARALTISNGYAAKRQLGRIELKAANTDTIPTVFRYAIKAAADRPQPPQTQQTPEMTPRSPGQVRSAKDKGRLPKSLLPNSVVNSIKKMTSSSAAPPPDKAQTTTGTTGTTGTTATTATTTKTKTKVWIAGTMTDWRSVAMAKLEGEGDHCVILDCPLGETHFKFCVQVLNDKGVEEKAEWVVDHGQEVEYLCGCGIGRSAGHGKGLCTCGAAIANVIRVNNTDREVFSALTFDSFLVKTERAGRGGGLAGGSGKDGGSGGGGGGGGGGGWSQTKPQMDGTSDRKTMPPILPPHLLQAILNKEEQGVAPSLSTGWRRPDPTVLPDPSNHVVFHHLYAQSVKDNTLVLATTTRYKKKSVTIVYYKDLAL